DLARQSAARPEEVLRSLRELGEWHFKGRVPSGDALRPWMPPEAPRELASELARAIHLRRPRRRDREAVAGELVMEYRAHGPARVTRGWDWRLATDEALEAGIEFEERWGGAAAAEDDEDEHGHRHGGHDHHAY
ncbi:MAG TPA: hypothetical protein VFQ45_23440, partial [Longimicrobium sp.]|nr:hypothetical protein [Longimicrobium sp.]